MPEFQKPPTVFVTRGDLAITARRRFRARVAKRPLAGKPTPDFELAVVAEPLPAGPGEKTDPGTAFAAVAWEEEV